MRNCLLPICLLSLAACATTTSDTTGDRPCKCHETAAANDGQEVSETLATTATDITPRQTNSSLECEFECAPGELCAPSGLCERDPRCESDRDCKAGEVCRTVDERICVPKTYGKVCQTDSDCSESEICAGVGASSISTGMARMCQNSGSIHAN